MNEMNVYNIDTWIGDFFELVRVDFRKESVALEVRRDLCQVDSVAEIGLESRGVNLGTSDHPDGVADGAILAQSLKGLL